MIAPMKKVHLVVLEREKAQALSELGKLGVVHLEPLAGKGADFEKAGRSLAEVERAVAILSSIKVPEPKKGGKATRISKLPMILSMQGRSRQKPQGN